MMRLSTLASIAGLVVLSVSITESFPNGAPVESCIYQTVPNHPGTKPQPAPTFYHEFVATAGSYRQGGSIHGNLTKEHFYRGTKV